MSTSLLEKLRELAAFPVERDARDPARSSYERFAIPYSFKPSLSFAEAVIAAGGALLRIFLGSLLFAVWGTYTFLAWSAIRNAFWRVAVLLTMMLVFAASLVLLMVAIAALVRTVWPRPRRRFWPEK